MKYKKTVLADGFSTLAGIKFVNQKLWLSQLFDIVAQDTIKSKSPAIPKWDGKDGKGNVWLANCVGSFDTTHALCPAYKVVPEGVVERAIDQPSASSGLASIFCCCKKDVSKTLSNVNTDEDEDTVPI